MRSVIGNRSDHCMYIKGAGKSTLSKDSLAPLIHSDPSDLGSLILFWIIWKERTQKCLDWIYDNNFFEFLFKSWLKAWLSCKRLSTSFLVAYPRSYFSILWWSYSQCNQNVIFQTLKKYCVHPYQGHGKLTPFPLRLSFVVVWPLSQGMHLFKFIQFLVVLQSGSEFTVSPAFSTVTRQITQQHKQYFAMYDVKQISEFISSVVL